MIKYKKQLPKHALSKKLINSTHYYTNQIVGTHILIQPKHTHYLATLRHTLT